MTAVQKRFAEEYGIPEHQVAALVGLALRAGKCNERACNGDPHPRAKDRTDKNECKDLWEADVATTTVNIADLVRPYGFTEVVYTGLGPTLKRGAQYVEVPY
jgi:hypothetical protein